MNDPRSAHSSLFKRSNGLGSKTKPATTFADFRPITCLNVAYKIKSTVMVTLVDNTTMEIGIFPTALRAVSPRHQGCVEAHIYSSAVSEIMATTRKPLYTIYAVLTKAFDRVPYPLINRLVNHIYG
ncbi:hypothetical protein RF11_06500 [Thelohanellus kitauei]|uniref:Reverse transcriptase domain-containing protein n=1 Tax=Thelohanellus kitauei TaxID=669202 RepID=A0A0C2NMD7_THEKT|nr:hypothetical protein RF11_06500 [Thelohanellus kitauei]